MNGTVVFHSEGVSPWRNHYTNVVNIPEAKLRAANPSKHPETWEILH